MTCRKRQDEYIKNTTAIFICLCRSNRQLDHAEERGEPHNSDADLNDK